MNRTYSTSIFRERSAASSRSPVRRRKKGKDSVHPAGGRTGKCLHVAPPRHEQRLISTITIDARNHYIVNARNL